MAAIFIGCAVVGLVVLGLALVVGEILEGLFDAIDSDIFSPLSLGSTTSVFGLVGLGLLNMALNPIGAILGAASAAAVSGFVTVKVLRSLMKTDRRDRVKSSELVGWSGFVVTTIPETGHGVVRFLVSGHDTRMNAQAVGEVSSGTKVRVIEVLSATSVLVEPESTPNLTKSQD